MNLHICVKECQLLTVRHRLEHYQGSVLYKSNSKELIGLLRSDE